MNDHYPMPGDERIPRPTAAAWKAVEEFAALGSLRASGELRAVLNDIYELVAGRQAPLVRILSVLQARGEIAPEDKLFLVVVFGLADFTQSGLNAIHDAIVGGDLPVQNLNAEAARIDLAPRTKARLMEIVIALPKH